MTKSYEATNDLPLLFCAYGDDPIKVTKALVKEIKGMKPAVLTIRVGFIEGEYSGELFCTEG